MMMSLIKEAGSNLVVLAGDTHNAWSSVLTMEDGSTVGVEFAVQAVSSPGLEFFLDNPATEARLPNDLRASLADRPGRPGPELVWQILPLGKL